MQAVQGRASFGLLHVDAAGMAAASMLMRELVSSGYLSCTLGAVQCQASLGLQHVDPAAVAAASMLTRDARASQLWLFIVHLGCSAVSGQFGPPACRPSCGGGRVDADS